MRKLLRTDVITKIRGNDAGMMFGSVLGLPIFPQQVRPIIRNSSKVGRNDLCKCGSGKKYKKCCERKE
jgi:hypothetical protein